MDFATFAASLRWLPLCALAAVLSACAPTTQEIRDPVAVPPRFVEAREQTAAEPLPHRWWLAFGDPVLDDLVSRALGGNLSLRATWDRLSQAKAAARKAGGELLPTVDLEAGASRSTSRSEFNGERRTVTSESFSLGLVAAYEVDLWGGVRSTRDAAELDLRGNTADVRAAAITLSAEVASTWYQLVEQYGQLDLLEEQVTTNQQVLDLTILRFRRGLADAADVLQQRQLLESNRGQKAQVQAQATVLEHELAILLGLPPGQTVAERVSQLVALPSLPQTGLPADLVRRRPDVRSAYYAVAAADRRVAAAIADRYPRVSLSAGASTSSDRVTNLFQDWLATLAANLVGPIFDAGLRRAEVERTRAVAAEKLNRYGQTILEALGEVESALAREARQRETLESLDRQLELATQVVGRVRDQYVGGNVDYLRVLDALLSQQQLQSSRLTTARELIDHRIALCRALAGGWEMERPGTDRAALL